MDSGSATTSGWMNEREDNFGKAGNSRSSTAMISSEKSSAQSSVKKLFKKLNVKGEEPESKSAEHSNNKSGGEDSGKLPQSFLVKYMGKRKVHGLWGVKYTRTPVDEMVSEARANSTTPLPFLQLTVSDKGVTISEMPQNTNKNFEPGMVPVDVISYGVQDVVYTRVFAMIVVKEKPNATSHHPFECHAFVCDCKTNARKLTYALAATFRLYSESVKGRNSGQKKFAIDLRSPDEIKADMQQEDSEA